MIACHRQRVDDDAAIDADHRQHDAEEQTEPEAGQQESEQVVPHVAVGQVHRLASATARAVRPSCNAALISVTTCAPSGRPATDLQPRILACDGRMRQPGASSARSRRSTPSPCAVKAGDGRLRHQRRLCERGDFDQNLRLLAQVEANGAHARTSRRRAVPR